MPRRSKKKEEKEDNERWLITYADLITLLLIFFVIMYAMSKVDVQKFKILAQALNFQFHQTSVVFSQEQSPIGKVDPGKKQHGDTKQVHGTAKNKNSSSDTSKTKEQQLQQMMKTVQQYIADHNLNEKITVQNTTRGIAIRLNDVFLFDLGKAQLKPPAYPVLDKLASLFPKLNAKISIEGNTDNLPLATGSIYQDNWGLGAARALSVLRYFVDNKHLNADQFMAVSYAYTNPVKPNDNNADRQKNRRVEIVILRDSLTGQNKAASPPNESTVKAAPK